MPTGSFIWGCFEATSKLKLVIVTLFVQQQLHPQQASPRPWLVKTSGGWSSDSCESDIQCSQSILSGVASKPLQTQVSYCLHCCMEWFSINPFYLLVCNCARSFHIARLFQCFTQYLIFFMSFCSLGLQQNHSTHLY